MFGIYSKIVGLCSRIANAQSEAAKVQSSTLDLMEKQGDVSNKLLQTVTKNFLIDSNGNIIGFRTNTNVDAPEGVFPKLGRHMSIYPIGWTGERYKNLTYEEYNAPTEIERHDNGVTVVFFGSKDRIKNASNEDFYTMDCGKVHYFAFKSDMTMEEFEGNINRYNMNPDENVEH